MKLTDACIKISEGVDVLLTGTDKIALTQEAATDYNNVKKAMNKLSKSSSRNWDLFESNCTEKLNRICFIAGGVTFLMASFIFRVIKKQIKNEKGE